VTRPPTGTVGVVEAVVHRHPAGRHSGRGSAGSCRGRRRARQPSPWSWRPDRTGRFGPRRTRRSWAWQKPPTSWRRRFRSGASSLGERRRGTPPAPFLFAWPDPPAHRLTHRRPAAGGVGVQGERRFVRARGAAATMWMVTFIRRSRPQSGSLHPDILACPDMANVGPYGPKVFEQRHTRVRAPGGLVERRAPKVFVLSWRGGTGGRPVGWPQRR